jgi:hypothetical protein
MGGAGLSGWDSHSRRGKEVGNGRKDLFKSWLNTLIVNRETNRQRTEGPCDLWYCIAGLRGGGGGLAFRLIVPKQPVTGPHATATLSCLKIISIQ